MNLRIGKNGAYFLLILWAIYAAAVSYTGWTLIQSQLMAMVFGGLSVLFVFWGMLMYQAARYTT